MKPASLDLETSFVLATRFPAEAIPGVAPGTWWIVERWHDETSARQQAYKLIPYLASLGAEAALLFLVQGTLGRTLESRTLVRHGTARPPEPQHLRALAAGKADDIRARCRAFHAPRRFRFGLRPDFLGNLLRRGSLSDRRS
ncbi:MAG TPA: hypothetical protein VIL65_17970 [Beijerinckiaceae bacterium]|jgi:hypothetical protein